MKKKIYILDTTTLIVYFHHSGTIEYMELVSFWYSPNKMYILTSIRNYMAMISPSYALCVYYLILLVVHRTGDSFTSICRFVPHHTITQVLFDGLHLLEFIAWLPFQPLGVRKISIRIIYNELHISVYAWAFAMHNRTNVYVWNDALKHKSSMQWFSDRCKILEWCTVLPQLPFVFGVWGLQQ